MPKKAKAKRTGRPPQMIDGVNVTVRVPLAMREYWRKRGGGGRDAVSAGARNVTDECMEREAAQKETENV